MYIDFEELQTRFHNKEQIYYWSHTWLQILPLIIICKIRENRDFRAEMILQKNEVHEKIHTHPMEDHREFLAEEGS